MKFMPYPKYKPSGVEWLGKLPEGWVPIKMKRLATILNGRDYKHIETSGDGYPVIGSGGEFAKATEYLYKGESILLGRKGTIDRPLYINGPFWVVDTMFYTQIGRNVFPKFLYYCATTIKFDFYSTSTAVPSMTQEDLGGIHFAVPKLDEQSSIATFLDRETAKIDTLISKQEKLIELLKEKRQAVISHAVTKGLNSNVKMKDSGIEWLGEVPEHWIAKRLKYISPFIAVGIVVNPSDYVSDDGLPFIYGGDITEGKIAFESSRRISDESSRRNEKTRLSAGDLLTVRVGAPGITAVVPPECEGGNCASVMLVRKGNYDSQWLCYAMNDKSVRYQVEVVQYGAAQEQFNISHAVNFWIATPPINEQQAITTFLDHQTAKINTLIAKAEQAIILQKEHRTALISAAVTGKIDVREAA